MKQLTKTDFTNIDILELLKQIRKHRFDIATLEERIKGKLSRIKELKKEVEK